MNLIGPGFLLPPARLQQLVEAATSPQEFQPDTGRSTKAPDRPQSPVLAQERARIREQRPLASLRLPFKGSQRTPSSINQDESTIAKVRFPSAWPPRMTGPNHSTSRGVGFESCSIL